MIASNIKRANKMIKYLDYKMTANQLAKLIVADKGIVGVDYWGEDSCIDHELLTEKENRDIQACLNKQYERVTKLLGIQDVWKKIQNT